MDRVAATRQRRVTLLGVTVGAIGIAASLLPAVLELEETIGLGALFAVRGPLPPPQTVAVISITGEAAVALGQDRELDEWPRQLHAALIDSLDAAGAAAIAFDVTFLEPREPQADQRLAASVAAAGNVLLAERVAQRNALAIGGGGTALIERREPPLAPLVDAALGTAPFVLPTRPVRLGQFWTFGLVSGSTPTLPALALQAYLLPHYDALLGRIEAVRPGATTGLPGANALSHGLDKATAALREIFARDPALGRELRRSLDGEEQDAAALLALVDLYSGPGSRYIDYYGPARTIATIPFDRALDPNNLDVAGRMVFVGFAETSQPDQQDDFYSVFSQRSGVNLSGVEVGATAFANLLERRTLRPLSMPLHWLGLLAFGIALAAAVARRSTQLAALAAVACVVLYATAAYHAFAGARLWLPLVTPLAVQVPLAFAAVLWWRYRSLVEQRERVHKALGYYVPPALADRIAADSVRVDTDSRLLRGTCLFTDAEHYTSVAETLRPDELAALMRDYFAAMFGVVEAYGGEISDTAGDSMVAIWASARPDAAMRDRARAAAVAVLDAVAEFNRRHPQHALPTRVGLESGELLLGNIGAEQRYEYRAIGDIVNTASRIQGLNRLLGTRVLMSAAAFADSQLPARDVGTFVMRGKRLPVRVYEPLAASVVALDAVALERFAAALSAFRAAAWAKAGAGFEAVLERVAGDGPSRYYAALAAQFEAAPPPRWSGAVELDEK